MIRVLSSWPMLSRIVQQPADLVVGVLEEAGEDLHHPRIELAFVGRQVVPLRDVGVVPRQHRVRGDDAQFLLPGEHLLAVGIPAVVEHALVLVGPFLGDVVRGVVGAGGEVQEERLVRSHLLEVGNELDGLVGQILRQVVALLRRLGRLDLMVVEDQVRDSTDGCRRRGSRSSARTRGPAATGCTAPRR